ncbi:hypothetical protein A5N54_13800, partial [Streptococcus pneumoniae]
QDGRIDVHCRDVGYATSQPGSQQPVAAPDVEQALGTEGQHGIQQRVVVDVGVPRLIHGDILLDGGVVARASPKLRRAKNPIQAGDLVRLCLVQPNPRASVSVHRHAPMASGPTAGVLIAQLGQRGLDSRRIGLRETRHLVELQAVL